MHDNESVKSGTNFFLLRLAEKKRLCVSNNIFLPGCNFNNYRGSLSTIVLEIIGSCVTETIYNAK